MVTPLCNHETRTDGCLSCHWWYSDCERGRNFRARFATEANPAPPPELLVAQPVPGGIVAATLGRFGTACVHRGAMLPELAWCDSCAGGKQQNVPLHACSVHGRCTAEKRGFTTRDASSPVEAWCRLCKDKAVFPPITTRNLLYHVYPVGGNGIWQRNVRQLTRRIRQFNGKRVVAILTEPAPVTIGRYGGQEPTLDAAIDPPAAVRAEFAGHGDVEFIELRNNAQLREVEAFLPLFESVESVDPGTATLYLQAKGVTRPADHTAHLWTEVLYETHLDYWGFVERLLRQFPICGAFKKLGHGWAAHQTASDWHYSGSWLWFRHDRLFANSDWRRIDQFWSGIEPYPSLHFRPHEAGELFMAGTIANMQLYPTGQPNTGWEYLTRTVMPTLVKWRAEHAADWRAWP